MCVVAPTCRPPRCCQETARLRGVLCIAMRRSIRTPRRSRPLARRTASPSPLGLRLGLYVCPAARSRSCRVAILRQEVGHCRKYLRSRDPDSNRGHHDFQQLLAPDDRAGPIRGRSHSQKRRDDDHVDPGDRHQPLDLRPRQRLHRDQLLHPPRRSPRRGSRPSARRRRRSRAHRPPAAARPTTAAP